MSLRESPNTLDYIAADTNIFRKIENVMVLPHLELSDHECLSDSIRSKGFYVRQQKNKVNSKNRKDASFKYVRTRLLNT